MAAKPLIKPNAETPGSGPRGAEAKRNVWQPGIDYMQSGWLVNRLRE